MNEISIKDAIGRGNCLTLPKVHRSQYEFSRTSQLRRPTIPESYVDGSSKHTHKMIHAHAVDNYFDSHPDPHPEWTAKRMRHGPQTHPSWPWEFEPVANQGPEKQSEFINLRWSTPSQLQTFFKRGDTVGEATRMRGFNRIRQSENDKNLYQYSNAMTSMQYKKPLYAMYGPMWRRTVYGVSHQHNRHGNMPFEDYY